MNLKIEMNPGFWMCRKATLPGFGGARARTEITRIGQSYQNRRMLAWL